MVQQDREYKAKQAKVDAMLTELRSLDGDSNQVAFAESELRRAGLFDADSDYNGMLGVAALDMVRLFSVQGHSGMSAGIVSSLLRKLLAQEPLTPLTGADDEWNDVGEISGRPWWQNKRCSRVFKEADGIAYDVQGIVWRDKSGFTYTNGKSRVNVVFPYTPQTEVRNALEAAQ